jgi:PII-like signaling protein
MDGFKQGRLLRIFVDETDRHGFEPMHTAILQLLRSKHVAGATAFRGIEGFGRHHETHRATLFSWLPNLPVLIEVVDDADKIDAIASDLEGFVGEGLMTMEAVEYLRVSRPGKATQPRGAGRNT